MSLAVRWVHETVSMTGYTARLLTVLGEPPARYRDAVAWSRLERDLGVALKGGQGAGTLFVENGEGEFFEYSMGFAEWLWRWLIGEEVTGPGGAAYYPGPVALRDLPMTPEERPEVRYGPSRGV